MGDFNLPSINWSHSYPLSLEYDPLTTLFTNCFNQLGLHQWIKVPTFTRSNNILDLVFTTEPDRIGDVRSISPLPGCDHIPMVFPFFHSIHPKSPTLKRNWNKGNYRAINLFLTDTDWDYEFFDLSLDDKIAKLHSIISPLINEHIPFFNSFKRRKSSRLFNSLKKRRSISWTLYKDIRSFYGRNSDEAIQALSRFHSLNHDYRQYFILEQISYEESLINDLNTDPNLFHRYIRKKKSCSLSAGPLKSPNGIVITEDSAMAELFASSFSSVYRSNTLINDDDSNVNNAAFLSTLPITLHDVSKILENLRPNSSMGPDNLHPVLLKNCSANLAYPLLKIFLHSLNSGFVPAEWKISKVIPIFKKGSRSDPLNYRPISLTSVVCKCLEKIICREIYNFLDLNNILSEDQYGFRAGRSIEDNLILTYDSVTKWIDENSAVDVILFDFSKAFDVVNHDLVIVRLLEIGIRNPLLSWISSFLKNRTMFVSINGSASSTYRLQRCSSGIGPQTSPLHHLRQFSSLQSH